MRTILLAAILLFSPTSFSQTDSTETSKLKERLLILKQEQAGLAALYQKEFEAAFQRYNGKIQLIYDMLKEDSLGATKADSLKSGKK